MDTDTYLEKRIEDQINWYSQKSKYNQNRYKAFKIATILLSVSIPFCTGLVEQMEWMRFIIGGMGVAIAAIEGIQSLYKFKDHWLQYRFTAEALIREKLLFQTLAGPYAEAEDPFKRFVARAEEIMAGEQTQWKELAASEEK